MRCFSHKHAGSPRRNFTDQGARDYWLNTFVEEICHEHEDHVGFTTVYFDEIDDNWCGYWGNATHGGCWFDNATQIKQAEAILNNISNIYIVYHGIAYMDNRGMLFSNCKPNRTPKSLGTKGSWSP